ncbi:MAG TPA: polyprenol monophosphomannose synthase [candidate division Zixibacteria bacterium]|nr:polyprenol monophosphomannose synthase [candidate division Zixibacteria bacterium]
MATSTKKNNPHAPDLPKILVVMPMVNEEGNITKIVPEVLRQGDEFHVLICEDESTDRTPELAEQLAVEHSGRVFVIHGKRAGLGPAYVRGFKWALERDYELVFEMDADFSHKPEYLRPMAEIIARGEADMVVGSRRVGGGGVENWGLYRKLLSWGGSIYTRLITGLPVKDATAGFVVYRRDVLEHIDPSKLSAGGYAFQIETKFQTWKAGYRIVEFPIIFPDRVIGETKLTKAIIKEAFTMVWKLRFSDSKKPEFEG